MAFCVDLEISLHRYPATDKYWVVGRFRPPDSDAPSGEEAVTRIDLDHLDLLARKLAYDAYGQRLTWYLFGPDPIRGLLDRARQVASSHDPPLPLRLRLQIGADVPELHRLHWELLRDPAHPTGLRIDLDQDGKLVADPEHPGRRLTTDESTLFSRYLLSSHPRPVRLQPRSHPKALVFVANPLDAGNYRDEHGDRLPPVDVQGEVGRARMALEGFSVTTLCSEPSLNPDGPPTLPSLLDCLHRENDLLYLVAHGTLLDDGQPCLYLEDEKGCAHPVCADDTTLPHGESVPGLLSQLSQLPFLPRLVVLASCHSASSIRSREETGLGEGNGDQELTLRHNRALSALGPRLVRIGVPAVVAMQGAVTMSTIKDCMPVFFTELRRDGLIDRAMAAARRAVQHRWDWWVPVLYTRLDSGLIFGPGGRALASYRQEVLRKTEFLELAGDWEGDLSLRMPLERLYIPLRAIPAESQRPAGAGEQAKTAKSAAQPAAPREAGPEQAGAEGEPAWVLEELRLQQTPDYVRLEFGGVQDNDRPRLWPEDQAGAGNSAASGNDLRFRRGPDSEPSDKQAGQDGAGAHVAESPPEPMDPEVLLKRHERLLIVGAAGSGKSTLLHWFARRAAQRPDKPLPVLISLRDYAAYRGAGGQDSLQTFALVRTAGDDAPRQQALEEAAQAGQILWLVDALDEALGWRKEAAREITRLPGRAVLTSRRAAYKLSELADWPCYEIDDLSPKDGEAFVRHWFGLLAERQELGEDWVTSRVAELSEQLARQPRLASLTANPLMLTFLVVLAGTESARDLPAQRSRLYERYVQTLATREVKRRPVEGAEGRPAFVLGPLKADLARKAALDGFYLLGSRLHWIYYGGRAAALPERERLVEHLIDSLDAGKAHSNLGRQEVMELARAIVDFWCEAGMVELLGLPGRPETYLRFRHFTFQEYAASRHLADLWIRHPDAVLHVLRARLHHHAWREVVLLLAEQLAYRYGAASELADEVLAARSPYEGVLRRDLQLAAEIVDHAPVDTPDLPERIARRTARLVTPWLVQVQRSLLWASWALGLLFLGLGLPWWAALPACVGWSALWVAAFAGSFARLRALLWLPARLPGLPLARTERVAMLAHLGSPAIALLARAMEDQEHGVRLAASKALSRVGEPAVAPLVRLCKSEDWLSRSLAYQSLGKIGDERAVEPLIKVLVTGDFSVTGAAEEALARIGGRAVPPLIAALDSGDRDVRWSVERILNSIGRATTEPFLRALSGDDPTPTERRVAALMLGHYGTESAVAPLCRKLRDPDPDLRRVVALSLGTMGERFGVESVRLAREPLSDALAHGEPQVRQAVAEALGRIGDKEFAFPLLIESLADEAADVRKAAVTALGHVGDPDALEALFAALDDLGSSRDLTDGCYTVSEAAVVALGRIGDPGAIPRLIRILADGSKPARGLAVEALSLIGERWGPEVLVESMPLFRQALADDWPNTRQAAAKALGRLGDLTVREDLVTMLEAEKPGDREAAAEALGYLGDGDVLDSLVRRIQDKDEKSYVRHAAIQSLGKIGDERAVEPLLRLAADLAPLVQRDAWQALESLGPVAVDPLIQMLQHTGDDMAKFAARALGSLGVEEAVNPLIQVLSSDKVSWDLGDAAQFALQEIGQPAVEPLLSALSSQEWEWSPRRRAVRLLQKIGQPAIDPLLDALVHRHRQVRLVAIEALGAIGDGQAVAPLCAILERDESREPEMRWMVAYALGQIGDVRALKPLLGASQDEIPNVRWAAARALGNIGDRRAMDTLLQALRDSSDQVRSAATLALGRCGDERAVKPLLRQLRDREPDVRRAAATVLGSLADQAYSIPLLRRVARGLWWCLTDTGTVPQAAYGALHQVVARLTELEVAELTWEDPRLPDPEKRLVPPSIRM